MTEDTVFGAAGHYFIGLQLFIDAHLVSKSIGTLEPRFGGTKSLQHSHWMPLGSNMGCHWISDFGLQHDQS